jgi:DNA mismatch endonuclease (patch repair protein)
MVAVFIDGCFWHRCPVHWKAPRRHAAWWTSKVKATVDRDAHTLATLEAAGWLVIRVWEHEDPDEATTRIAMAVSQRRQMNAVKPSSLGSANDGGNT